MDSIEGIIVHLIKIALTYIKTNREAGNRHPSGEKFALSCAREERRPALPRQHRKLQNEDGSGGGDNGNKRLREPDYEDCGCHGDSPLNESIEQLQLARAANAQQTQYLTVC